LNKTIAILGCFGLLSAATAGPRLCRAQAKQPRIVLRWSAVEEAKEYELEIAEDREFTRVVVKEKVPLNGYRWRAAPKTPHYFRVRSIDSFGRKGEWSKPKEIAAVKPPEPPKPRPRPEPVEVKPPDPPELVRPAGGESVVWQQKRKPRVRLIWNERPEASSYQVEVSADRDFGRRPMRFKVSGTQKTFRAARMGPFFWRVRCASPKSEWSRTGSFRVVPATPEPTVPEDGAAVELGEGQDRADVALGWQAVPYATGYEVTLSTGQGESEPTVQTVEGESLTLTGLEIGRYSWSVRALHRKAAASEPSEPRGFELAAPAPPPTVVEVPPPVEEKPKPKKVAEKKPEPVDTAPEEPEDRPAYLYIAPRLGFLYNLGEVVAPRFEGEIGGRLPVLDRRLGLALSAGYYTVSTTSSAAELSLESRLKVVPIETVVVFSFPASWLDLYLGAGLAVDLIISSVQVPTQPVLEETRVGLGPLGLLGAEKTLGPGRLFLQLSYQLASRSREGIVESDPGGLGAAIGYRIGLIN
jgi:hypothetical protein